MLQAVRDYHSTFFPIEQVWIKAFKKDHWMVQWASDGDLTVF